MFCRIEDSKGNQYKYWRRFLRYMDQTFHLYILLLSFLFQEKITRIWWWMFKLYFLFIQVFQNLDLLNYLMVVLVLTFVNRISFAMLISMPMVHLVEERKVFALTMKTDMTAKAPQYFVKIVIQNAEEESVQLLVNLLALNNNVLIIIYIFCSCEFDH